MTNRHEGGCRCGAARYEVALMDANTMVCHCLDCQRHLGAPFSVFTAVPAKQFRWLTAPSGKVTFSATADRLFCNECGTYLKWEGKQTSSEAEFNSMTLDDPSRITVNEEIFTRSRLAWITPLENIPQHAAARTG